MRKIIALAILIVSLVIGFFLLPARPDRIPYAQQTATDLPRAAVPATAPPATQPAQTPDMLTPLPGE